MGDKYDFIIVGGGNSGAVIAGRLSQTAARPSVLLLESGPDTRQLISDAPAEMGMRIQTHPHLDHAYSTISEKGLNDREIPYYRGKGLGGSTLLNHRVWTCGPAADYDRWADIVGNEMWRWKNVGEKFKQIENYHIEIPAGMEEYANPDPGIHGDSGPVDLRLPRTLDKEYTKVVEAAEELGCKRNLDMNSGNPIGTSLKVTSQDAKKRITSATAYLNKTEANLDLWTDSKVARVLFEDKKTIGVELVDGRKVFSKNEVVLAAGSIDSPKVLLLSGIGPTTELESHNIKTIHDLPGVGKNLQDHLGTPFMSRTAADFSDHWATESSPTKMAAARKQWQETQTGPLSDLHSNLSFSFIKLPTLYDTPEFQALDPATQTFLREESVPHYEFISGSLNFAKFDFGSDSYLSVHAIALGLRSRGSVTLATANPEDKPVIHFGFLTHPFDRRLVIEGTKEVLSYLKTETLAPYIKEQVLGPASNSDSDILKYFEEKAGVVYHAAGSVKMGRAEDDKACVDSKFRVFGVQGLRVADMSVTPELTHNHAQATAYLIGELAADVLIAEYSLA